MTLRASQSVPPPRFLFIVFKATSELDFGLPLLGKLRERYPDARIDVVYSVINRERILRGATFYSRFFRDHGITEWDFADFLFPPVHLFRSVLRQFSRLSYWDGVPVRDGGWSSVKALPLRIVRVARRLIDTAALASVDLSGILARFDPDVIFFPLRDFSFPFKDGLIRRTYAGRAKVVLTPHGAFSSTGFDHLHYGRDSGPQPLPDFCYYWYPCDREETVARYPALSSQMRYVGYTGLDSEWFDYVRQRYPDPRRQTVDGRAPLRCLFIIRKFLPKAEYAVFDEREFRSIVDAVVGGLRRSGRDIRLVVKGHPSNDLDRVRAIFDASGYANWELTREPIYLEITRADFVVSVPSTSTLVPAMHGLPVIFLNCSVLDQFYEAWPFMRTLLSGLEFHVERLAEFDAVLGRVLERVQSGSRVSDGEDLRHFRQFYPDGSLQVCMEHVETLIGPRADVQPAGARPPALAASGSL